MYVGVWEEGLVIVENGEHEHQLAMEAIETVLVLTRDATGNTLSKPQCMHSHKYTILSAHCYKYSLIVAHVHAESLSLSLNNFICHMSQLYCIHFIFLVQVPSRNPSHNYTTALIVLVQCFN